MRKRCTFVDKKYMKKALLQAKKAYKNDEIPVGCVIVYENKIIACGYNKKEGKNNAIMHAEMIAINKASKKMGTWRLDNCELYVSLEPCMMCMGAIIESRIKNVYYGAKQLNKQMYDKGIVTNFINLVYMKDIECSMILSNFFINKRKK